MCDIPLDSSRRAEYEYAKIFCGSRLEKKLWHAKEANNVKVKGPPYRSKIFEIFLAKLHPRAPFQFQLLTLTLNFFPSKNSKLKVTLKFFPSKSSKLKLKVGIETGPRAIC
jgi:hypothetical protein